MAAIALRRPLTLGASVLAGATLLVALAHTAPMRPVLARLGRLTGTGSCPMTIANVTPQELETHRVRATESLAGTQPSKRAVAGPFVLVTTTRGDVDAWAREKSVSCAVELAGTSLRCRDVAASALAPAGDALPLDLPASDALFRFDTQGRLVALDVMRHEASAADAAAVARAIVARLERDLGPKSAAHGGELDAANLEAPGMRMTEVQFRFVDCAADVSVFRTLDRGPLVVREQYRAVAR